MWFDWYGVYWSSTECAKKNVKVRKYSKTLTLFQGRALLDFVVIDTLGELIWTPPETRYLLLVPEQFPKLLWTVLLKQITAEAITQAFNTHWMLIWGPIVNLLSAEGPQFISKFFQDICTILDVRNMFVTIYYPQGNEQVEQFNRMVPIALRSYVADQPKD